LGLAASGSPVTPQRRDRRSKISYSRIVVALAVILGGYGTPPDALAAAQEASRTAGAFYLDVYGLSYHPDREGVHREHLDNEVNEGLGLKYGFHDDALGVGFVQAGAYRDSGSNWAKIAGPGYQLKLGDHWRAGGLLLYFDSPTYNHGRPFVAPIPIFTYDFGALQLNAVYAPRVPDYNQFAVFGFYLSIPFARGAR
jgi:hypothetical protein